MTLEGVNNVGKMAEAAKAVKTVADAVKGLKDLSVAVKMSAEVMEAVKAIQISGQIETVSDLVSAINLTGKASVDLVNGEVVLADVVTDKSTELVSAGSIFGTATAATEGDKELEVNAANVGEIASQENIKDVDANAVVDALKAEGKTTATAEEIKA